MADPAQLVDQIGTAGTAMADSFWYLAGSTRAAHSGVAMKHVATRTASDLVHPHATLHPGKDS
jgi:hypothetical protein